MFPSSLPSVAQRSGRLTPETLPIDPGAAAAHGIGRGDFAAVVFSGDAALLGEVPGYGTWLAGRKYALPDPRLPADKDLARTSDSPLPLWSGNLVAPAPGVCFVFTDDAHPAVDVLRARDAEEFEHFVVLPRLTREALLDRRLDRFLRRTGARPIVLLGFGDQGERIALALKKRAVSAARLGVLDDRPERLAVAHALGFGTVRAIDAIPSDAAILSTPLACPAQFRRILEEAGSTGRAWLDNSLPWDDAAEYESSGSVLRTGCARRATTLSGARIRAADHGLAFTLLVAQQGSIRIGDAAVPTLAAALRVPLGLSDEIDLSRPVGSHPFSHRVAAITRSFVHLDGQSNHQDAAATILAARSFLHTLFPDAADATVSSRHRGTLGATPFEHALVRTTTGRSLGSPYMTNAEQTALGVLARHGCGNGAGAAPIIEIGSAIGGSTLLMAAATQAATPADGPIIYSIDPDIATRPAMQALFAHSGHAPRLRQLVMTSDRAAQDLRHLRSQVGFVFIDGLHTQACSARDFELYLPMVRPGGLIAFHDCDIRHAGVFATVSRIARSERRVALRALIGTIAVFERAE